ncbi:hypothetical protein GCM10007870_29680 [Gluconobacter kondonii]|uniref:Uncharacterized protein n=1 Tax=Gluconobacter kondonii TaxID=941463 RepID=A0ABQ5WVZ3_9PROT|nr:hypothetical protein AA3266_2449 [Gluconobacter kondonii NBRC 3266]GLQ67383.1 hypothetical protein GCM10007870_29680 [Gluconobacter kondonii]
MTCDKQTTQDRNSTIKTFYHATNFENERSIRRQGLIPKARNYVPWAEEPRVWLSDDRDHIYGDIIYKIIMDVEREGGKLTPTGMVGNGRGGYPEWAYDGNIPFSSLTEIYRRSDTARAPQHGFIMRTLKRLFGERERDD